MEVKEEQHESSGSEPCASRKRRRGSVKEEQPEQEAMPVGVQRSEDGGKDMDMKDPPQLGKRKAMRVRGSVADANEIQKSCQRLEQFGDLPPAPDAALNNDGILAESSSLKSS